MSTPYHRTSGDGTVVVQGRTVQSGGFSQALEKDNGPSIFKASPTQQQSPRPPTRGCRDVFFALLFYVHIGAIAYAAARCVPVMAQDFAEGVVDQGGRRRLNEGADVEERRKAQGEEEVNSDIDPVQLLIIVAISACFAFILSTGALSFMLTCAGPLIKTALIFNVGLFCALSILAFVVGNIPMGAMLVVLTLLSVCYTYSVWERIPFAAANLVTAITAVRANMGLALYAYWSVFIFFLWSIVWALSTAATVYVVAECNPDGECTGEINGFLIFGFLVSFYWTSQVISNVVHVTTAGTVGTWWFHPQDAGSCCSKAVRESYGRSLTTSFGSICLGSLLVAIVQALKEMVHQMRELDDSVLRCLAECILGCIESLIEYFNKWAFVYVGLYGYSFMEAGSNVMGLFRSRGWTAIIADMMLDTVLFMVSLGVALLVGVLSAVVGIAMEVEDDATTLSAFLLGLLVGYGVCATLFSLVSSGVNTVIVCYAEAPNEFQMNHPELSERMRVAWHQAWPNQFNY